MALILNKNIASGELVQDSITDGVLNKAPSQNAVFDALALKIPSSEKGAANGVATLDGAGKIPSAQLTVDAFQYLGTWNATTNSPSLANGVGSTGDLYHVSVAGSVNFGAGAIAFDIGDKVAYNGSVWEKWDFTQASDTDTLPEGSTNLYFTEPRVLGTDLLGYSAGAGGETVAAADTVLQAFQKVAGNQIEIDANVNDLISLSGVAENSANLGSFTGTTIADSSTIKSALQALETSLESVAASPISFGKESFTISAGDITNQYIDLLQVIKASSLDFMFSGLVHREGADYSVSLTGGAGGKTRITFLGQLATAGASELVATDVVYVKYAY